MPLCPSLRCDYDTAETLVSKEKGAAFMSKRLSLPVVLMIAVALVLVTFMATFTVVSMHYREVVAQAYVEGAQSIENNAVLQKIDDVIGMYQRYSVYEWDEEAAIDSMLKAYAGATGDKYAAYYTEEEFEELTADNDARTVGVGISIIPTEALDGLELIQILPDSPAEEVGMQVGDIIVGAMIDGVKKTVSELGYNQAVSAIKGEEGTSVQLFVLRGNEELSFTLTRRTVTTVSVMSHVCTTDATVGYVRISGFDTKTPMQFDAAMDDLIAKGCTSFVIDLRHNPGGDLLSVEAVLARFLNKGDIMLRTVSGGEQTEKEIRLATYEPGKDSEYYGCTITSSDIGKYRGYKLAVLAGPNTASAAELMTACLQDYDLACVVGEVTFGKGIMQTIIPLSGSRLYSGGGAVKMTSAYYNPPFSDNYNGIGITPDVTVTLDEALANKNIYRITDEEDNQLQTAIAQLK